MSQVERGQAWIGTGERGGVARVMAVADNYVMARFKGCAPFVQFEKDFLKVFKRYPAFDTKRPKPKG